MIPVHENMTPADLIGLAKSMGCTATTTREGAVQLAAPPGMPQVSSFMRVRVANGDRNGNAVRWLRQISRALAQRLTVKQPLVVSEKVTNEEPGFGTSGSVHNVLRASGPQWKNKALARLRERITHLRRR